jgi:hypothetical protein
MITRLHDDWYVIHEQDWKGDVLICRDDWRIDLPPTIPVDVVVGIVAEMVRKHMKENLNDLGNYELLGM